MLGPIEADDDPHRLARLFIRQKCHHADGSTLRYWREEWHRWDGSAYQTLSEKELRAELTAFVKLEMDRVNLTDQKRSENDKPLPVVRNVTGRLIADVVHALESLTVLPSRLETPCWIGGEKSLSLPEKF